MFCKLDVLGFDINDLWIDSECCFKLTLNLGFISIVRDAVENPTI
jgi:hypothetical protein